MEVGRFSPLTYGRDVRVSPQDPRTLYACLSPAARSQDGSLYRSLDLGQSWTRFDHGVKAETTMMAVALNPRDPEPGLLHEPHGPGLRDGGRRRDLAGASAARGRAGRLRARVRLER